jgi:hypothetical protein
MNEPEFLKAARHLAHETLADSTSNANERFAALYETISSRLPDEQETEKFILMVQDLEQIYKNNTDLADQLCDGVTLHKGVTAAQLSAWTMLVSALYNLDITKTRS